MCSPEEPPTTTPDDVSGLQQETPCHVRRCFRRAGYIIPTPRRYRSRPRRKTKHSAGMAAASVPRWGSAGRALLSCNAISIEMSLRDHADAVPHGRSPRKMYLPSSWYVNSRLKYWKANLDFLLMCEKYGKPFQQNPNMGTNPIASSIAGLGGKLGLLGSVGQQRLSTPSLSWTNPSRNSHMTADRNAVAFCASYKIF